MNKFNESINEFYSYDFETDKTKYWTTKSCPTFSELNSTIDEINKLEFKLKVLEDRLRWKNWRWK